jgi:hypothetical protein
MAGRVLARLPFGGRPDNSEVGFGINVLFWGSRNRPEKGSVRVSERNETKSLRACRSKGIIRGLGCWFMRRTGGEVENEAEVGPMIVVR